MCSLRTSTRAGVVTRTGAKFQMARTPAATRRSVTCCATRAGVVTIASRICRRRTNAVMPRVERPRQQAPWRPPFVGSLSNAATMRSP